MLTNFKQGLALLLILALAFVPGCDNGPGSTELAEPITVGGQSVEGEVRWGPEIDGFSPSGMTYVGEATIDGHTVQIFKKGDCYYVVFPGGGWHKLYLDPEQLMGGGQQSPGGGQQQQQQGSNPKPQGAAAPAGDPLIDRIVQADAEYQANLVLVDGGMAIYDVDVANNSATFVFTMPPGSTIVDQNQYQWPTLTWSANTDQNGYTVVNYAGDFNDVLGASMTQGLHSFTTEIFGEVVRVQINPTWSTASITADDEPIAADRGPLRPIQFFNK